MNSRMIAAVAAMMALCAVSAFGEGVAISSRVIRADFDTRLDSPRRIVSTDEILPFALADEGTITVADDAYPSGAEALSDRGDGTAVWIPRYRGLYTATHSSGLTAKFDLTTATDVSAGNFTVSSDVQTADFDMREGEVHVYHGFAGAIANLAYSNAADWHSGGDADGSPATVRLTPMSGSSNVPADWKPAGDGVDLVTSVGEGTVAWEPIGNARRFKAELLLGSAVARTSYISISDSPLGLIFIFRDR